MWMCVKYEDFPKFTENKKLQICLDFKKILILNKLSPFHFSHKLLEVPSCTQLNSHHAFYRNRNELTLDEIEMQVLKEILEML